MTALMWMCSCSHSRGENDWSPACGRDSCRGQASLAPTALFEVASKTYRDKARRAKASMDEADYASSSDDEGAALQQGRGGTQLIRTHSVLRYVCAPDARSHAVSPSPEPCEGLTVGQQAATCFTGVLCTTRLAAV